MGQVEIVIEALIGRRIPRRVIPKGLRGVLAGQRSQVLLHETFVTNENGERIPVRLAGVTLKPNGLFAGAALLAQDLREIKQLEHEKLEAERLAAVGQTVAGLAHGIKNILTGLEGGMYVTSSGLKKGDQGRVRQGWEMLERNMGRISDLTRNLLAFSRGEAIECREIRAEVLAALRGAGEDDECVTRHGRSSPRQELRPRPRAVKRGRSRMEIIPGS